MTLIEVMFSLAILGIAASGVLSATLQSRRLSEGSIYQNTATTIAQGYLEQIKNMEFASLDLDVLPTLINQGAADTLNVSPWVADIDAGAETDVVNLKRIDINNTPDNEEDDMQMEIVAYIDDVTDQANGLGECRLIALRYKYTFATAGRTFESENTLWAMRSRVPTF